MRRSGALLLAGFALCAGVAAACSLAFPLDGYGPPGPDAGPPPSDAASDAADAAPGCPLDRWPDRPAADDPGGSNLAITLAVDRVELGFGDAGAPPGYDLDGLCTCPDPSPCIAVGPMCDREGGVDNAMSDLLNRFASFGEILDQARTNKNIAKGNSTFLLVVHSYNGLANDQSVEVAVFLSDGTPADDAGVQAVPKMDGTDVWTVDRRSAVGESGPPILPKYLDTAAYVAGGVLVAHVDFPLQVGSGSQVIDIQLSGGVLTGTLAHDTIWRLSNGRIAGRWGTGAILTGLSVLTDPFGNGQYLCGDSGTYQALKPQICASADIMATSTDDRTGKKCDALSVGIGIHAIEAVEGSLAPLRDILTPCGPSWADSCAR